MISEIVRSKANFLGLQRILAKVPAGVDRVEVDFSNSNVVDHTVLNKRRAIADEWPMGRALAIVGLENHEAMSGHEEAARRRRTIVA